MPRSTHSEKAKKNDDLQAGSWHYTIWDNLLNFQNSKKLGEFWMACLEVSPELYAAWFHASRWRWSEQKEKTIFIPNKMAAGSDYISNKLATRNDYIPNKLAAENDCIPNKLAAEND